MWVVTVFNKDDVQMFQYQTKAEAENMLAKHRGSAILSFTN